MADAKAEALSLVRRALMAMTDRDLIEKDRGTASLASLYLRCAEEVLTGEHGAGPVARIGKGE